MRAAHATNRCGTSSPTNVTPRRPSHVPAADSVEHFFKEHEWGFGTSRDGRRRVTYRVVHDVWAVHPVESYDVRFDLGAAYGERWAFLNSQTPHHVALAAGGPVKVYPWRGDVVSEA